MTKKLVIGIDITDWRDEMQRIEPREIQTADDIVALVVDDGHKMVDVGKFAVVQEEMSVTKKPVITSRIMQIKNAARADVNVIIANRKRTVETESGKKYDVREFVAVPSTKLGDADNAEIAELGENPVVSFDSEPGLNRCLYYLRKVVPGHIWNRLVQIHGAGGDVDAIVDEMKAEIDDMVGRLE